jgi:guanylate kinase
MDFYFTEDAEMWSRNVFYGFEQRPNIWKLESRKKYHWTMFMKNFKDIENITAMMNKSAGMLEMYNAFKKNVEKEKIEKAVEDCKKVIEERAVKLKNCREEFMQFSGALQTTNFYEEREY